MEMEQRTIKMKSNRIDSMNYLYYAPKNEKKEKKPLIVFLHGAGERGDDFELLYVHGFPKYIRAGLELDAYVIAPQCPKNTVWNNLTVELKSLIDFVIEDSPIDENAVSLCGMSMGGFGTWEMGMSYPGFFASLAPICGGGMSWRVELIGKTPVWAFHGDMDPVVPPKNSLEMVDKLKEKGGNVRLTLFHGVEHNSWENAFLDTNLVNWLVNARKR